MTGVYCMAIALDIEEGKLRMLCRQDVILGMSNEQEAIMIDERMFIVQRVVRFSLFKMTRRAFDKAMQDVTSRIATTIYRYNRSNEDRLAIRRLLMDCCDKNNLSRDVGDKYFGMIRELATKERIEDMLDRFFIEENTDDDIV